MPDLSLGNVSFLPKLQFRTETKRVPSLPTGANRIPRKAVLFGLKEMVVCMNFTTTVYISNVL
jgi:hypothetical protein